MKTLLNPWFITGCLVWLMVFVFRRLHYPFPAYSNSYLTDLFAIPVIANTGLWFMRTVVFKNNLYQLSAGQIIFIIIYVSILFEFILPHFFKQYTSDVMDVIMYIIGGIFFSYKMNNPIY